MGVTKELFGKDTQGRDVTLYTIENEKGMKAQVTDYGAILVRLFVPTREGSKTDVVLGYDSVEGYERNPSFFGATIGPNANRIAGACFELEGITYLLDVNDNENNLHSHREYGYHKRLWRGEIIDKGVVFFLEDQDGSMGFPGNKRLEVTYSLDEEQGLTIHYRGESDKKTVLNLTNHSYFNLDGHGSGSIEEHSVRLYASHYTPVRAGAIPTGEIAPCKGTPMDFEEPHKVGERIRDDFAQLLLTGGYDHNWVIDGADGKLRKAAEAEGAASGISMEVWTTLPGMQFYAGNFLMPEKGKDGAEYTYRSGLCMETQFYPNSVNTPSFPSCIAGEGKVYEATTVYRFRAE